MKKRNVKNLQLNKSKVSNFIKVTGGAIPGGNQDAQGHDTLGGNPSAYTDGCPPSLPHTDCNCGSDFNKGCGSIIGHC